MSSGSVFSETLQTITTTKLEELAKKRDSFESEYSLLLKEVNSEQDPLKRLIRIVDGTKSCLGITAYRDKLESGRPSAVFGGGARNLRLDVDLRNVDRFLEQAKFDPTMSRKVFDGWQATLLQYLSIQSTKFQYADLYGKLVTEWLSSEKGSKTDGDVEMTESFEELPGAKKLEARTEWEKSVFEPAEVDVEALKVYLQSIFEKEKGSAAALNDLHNKVQDLESSLSDPGQFNVPTLRWVVQGLAASDLLSDEKREALKDFLSNEVILNELADVLNMRMAALDQWSWGDFVALEQRRKLNGQWSIHMDAELLQAIFLHYIGAKWSVFFKEAFSAIRNDTAAWQSNNAEISKTDRIRRSFYLGEHGSATYGGLTAKRNKTHRKTYFCHQLLDHDAQQIEVQEGEEEAAFEDYAAAQPKRPRTKQTARKSVHSLRVTQQLMPRQTPASSRAYLASGPPILADEDDVEAEECEDDDDDDYMEPKRPMEAKQGLLQLVAAEIIVNTQLYGELTCFRTAFESWNPLLPHQTVLTILEFLGVSKKWQAFFTKFLQAPLKFSDDGTSAEPRLRRRGAPGSYTLSDMLGETVLFCLDYAVNKNTNGALLYRLYDDVWFWNKDYEACAKAWESINTFVDVMGVELDNNKTGGIRVSRNNDLKIDDRVPEGAIRWGFLHLDPKSGRFEIDQKMVDGHIAELRKQLQSKKSVIEWIQAYNSYAATFFSSNFGKAANCFGRDHIDKMLTTHRHIQQTLFDGGNVVQHLKDMISSRFAVTDIPDGFLFFPVELGGLDLKSPFIGPLQIRGAVQEDPYDLVKTYEEDEREAYNSFKDTFDRGEVRRNISAEDRDFIPQDAHTFFPFEEFVRHREEYNRVGKASLGRTYTKLLERPKEAPVNVSPVVRQALDQLSGNSNLRGIVSNWGSMDAYWKYTALIYGPEMVQKFGGLNVVDFGLLPIGMVGFFRERRTKWQG